MSSKSSFGSSYEVATAKALEALGIGYYREVTFPHPYVHRLRYDFYLPQYNTLIEIDGQQHFRQVKRFQPTTIHWAMQAEKDVRKSDFALRTGIRLLRISYSQIRDVYSIIYGFLSSNFPYYFSDHAKYHPHLKFVSLANPSFVYNYPFFLSVNISCVNNYAWNTVGMSY